jgi:hypothetical protein
LQALRRNWLARGAHTPEWTGIHPFPGSLEVLARLSAGDDVGALQLIRREWGYMLDSPLGTDSTFWEGYKDDGTFGYEGLGTGYTSLAHGWSTGPTSALTFFVLGICPSYDDHYLVRPHPGDLSFAQGDLRVPAGTLTVDWTASRKGFRLVVDAPRTTVGEADVPVPNGDVAVRLDGRLVWRDARTVALGARLRGGYVEIPGLRGGPHRVEVTAD